MSMDRCEKDNMKCQVVDGGVKIIRDQTSSYKWTCKRSKLGEARRKCEEDVENLVWRRKQGEPSRERGKKEKKAL